MKISEIITDKYKLRMPPTVYYELLADVVEVEEEQEPKKGHWIYDDVCHEHGHCSECGYGRIDLVDGEPHNFCRRCGAKMVKPQESEDE